MDVKASCKPHTVQRFLIIQVPDGTEPVFSLSLPTPPPAPAPLKSTQDFPQEDLASYFTQKPDLVFSSTG